MALWDVFKNAGNRLKNYVYAKMLNGYTPVFSQFGDSIYSSDVVQNCIDIIATECSKLQPRHIRTDSSGMQTTPKSSLNRLFRYGPNPIMTTRDFLEKTIWLLFLNFNAFIYPTFVSINDPKSGNEMRTYTGFYPLNPRQVDFLQDDAGTLFVKLYFSNGESFTLPYRDVIHLRKKFSVNDIMGGGMNGQPDNSALLKVLQINDVLLQGLEKGIKTSMSIRGIIKINTIADDDSLKAERRRFEERMASGDTGILPVDLKGEYTPINSDPKMIDRDTLQFLQSKAQNWFGVSAPIISGDYTDEQYQAFYEKTLEPIVLGLGQAFTKCLFTDREQDVGNEIVFYQRDMFYLSTNAKLNLLKIAGEQGLLTDNQKLALLGYPPIEGGEKRTMSLNYIDVDLANAYQMGRAKADKGVSKVE
ncbi:phage portal protein [Tumebacillus flagellatus]|uniref:Portal protein n=1 Tax=Tumebacillus flagellatus TaxID=1157490 RepID=A0A074LK71_9BACL|nr:phage portal protein [Tumebacillus flagellatus]KEO81499.1 portal protein [Tumebacillus flagellatus]